MDEMKDRIRKIREDLHLSQARFATRLDVSFPTVQGWEYGRATPSPAMQRVICEELGINPEWLIKGTGNKDYVRDEALIDKITKKYNASRSFRAIMSCYMDLSNKDQEVIESYIMRVIETVANDKESTED